MIVGAWNVTKTFPMSQKGSYWTIQDKKKCPLEAQIVFKRVFKEVESGQKKVLTQDCSLHGI